MKKYFLCSDIHSDFEALKEAMSEHNFDKNNESHILVIAGDIFDRGDETVELYRFLKDMTDKGRAIVLNGNHHEMLINFLEKQNERLCFFNYCKNGLRYTIDDLLHRTCAWDMFVTERYNFEDKIRMTDDEISATWSAFLSQSADTINEEYPELLSWMKSMPDYLELKNNVITHGMIDGNSKDWRKPDIGWSECHWARPYDAAFMKNTTGRHVYVGHMDSDTVREQFHIAPNDFALFTRPSGDVTYLDSCTVYSHRVNMVVIEDEPVE